MRVGIKIIEIILEDIRVDLTNQFDENFERKGFFSQKWKPTKRPNPRGSLMERTNYLRKSISSVTDNRAYQVVFKSSAPYASVHNEGGTINMPARKQVLHFNKKGRFNKNDERASYAQKANVGAYTIDMPKRQFIGTAPETDKIIDGIVHERMPRNVIDFIDKMFKK
ncbi:phage virion morphogenesis protein [Dysgonomonas sp. ZJ279]|uniref:phage virion morphogenesis protein n=1 Tax=Dysgonomonas sp. ZJ279 TaxID=2709796 RepID=UPI0013EE063A|nr:phage virion morphogenesis protein [Dysgonomonas sp. ZJ279]